MKQMLLSVAALGAVVLTASCSGSSGTDAGPTPGRSVAASSAAPSAAPPSGAGTPAGQATVALTEVRGTSTRLAVDAGFLDALRAVGLSIATVDGATTDTAGGTTTFVFPITGGTATSTATGPDRFAGSVQHSGGLRVSGLGQSVTLDGFVLDGGTDQLTAEVAGRRVPLLPLEVGPTHVTTGDRQIVLDEPALSLTPDALQALADQLHLPGLPSVALGSLRSTITGG